MPKAKLKDIIGQTFAHLTVLERASNTSQGSARWLCSCDCGNLAIVRGASLHSGEALQCIPCSKIAGGLKRRKANHHNWKGGRHQTSDGYIRLNGIDHPNATKDTSRQIFEHTYIVSQYIGRPLYKDEFDSTYTMFLTLYYVLNCTGGAVTASYTNDFGSSFCHIWVGEYSGIATSAALDQTASGKNNINSPTTAATGSLAQSEELALGFFYNSNAKLMTWDSPWTEQDEDVGPALGRTFSAASIFTSSTSAITGSGTWDAGGNADYGGIVATFKAVAAGGGATNVGWTGAGWW